MDRFTRIAALGLLALIIVVAGVCAAGSIFAPATDDRPGLRAR